MISLQRHQLACHRQAKEKIDEESPNPSSPIRKTLDNATPYFCSFCMFTFKTPQEALLHRRTSSHKEMVKLKKANTLSETQLPIEHIRRDCPHCYEQLNGIDELKRHLLNKHLELCYR